jgi:hypothetical protein
METLVLVVSSVWHKFSQFTLFFKLLLERLDPVLAPTMQFTVTDRFSKFLQPAKKGKQAWLGVLLIAQTTLEITQNMLNKQLHSSVSITHRDPAFQVSKAPTIRA